MKFAVSFLMAVGFLLAGGCTYNFIHEIYPDPPVFGAFGALVVWVIGWRVVTRRNK
jgi:hypothetical protein